MKTSPCRVAFCVSGAGRIARAAVEQADSLGIAPVLLVCEDRAAVDLDAFCATHDLPFLRLPSERAALDRQLLEALRSAQPDLICLTFDKLLPPEIVALWPGRILNLHMGLLPATAGLHPLRRTIESGSPAGGATIHEVTTGVDPGPVVSQVEVRVLPEDTPETLGARIFPLAKQLMLDTLARYARDGRF